MAFDSSALQDIQPPDIVGGIAKGFQLKDMVDTQQLNALKIKSEKNTLADDEKAKGILSSSDLSSNKGIAEASEKLTRAGVPGKAMELRKYGQQMESGELDNQRQKVELHSAAQDVISSSVDRIWTQAKTMKDAKTQDGRPRYSDASIDAWIQGQLPMAVNGVQSDDGLPDPVKKTALQGMNQFLAQSQGKVTYDMLTQVEQSSKQGAARLKSMREDLVAQTGQKREAETERHNQSMEVLALRKTEDSEKKAKAVADARATFSGRNGDLMAALAERGVSLPAGFRSKDQQMALLNGLWTRNPEASADDIAAKIQTGQLSFGNAKTEGRVAAGVAGKVTYAEHELEQTIPLVREASAKLPRGQFIPWNKLKQMGQKEMSNPDLAEFSMYMTSLSNAYDMLAARGGTDAAKREEGRRNFDTAPSPEALEGVLRAVQKEASASGRAADQSMADAAGRGNPKSPTSPGKSGEGAAPTKILRFDAQGNPVS
jgi:hypothetical protein